MDKIVWEDIKQSFQHIAQDATRLAAEENFQTLRSLCDNAGEYLFEMVADNQFEGNAYDFTPPDWARIQPIELLSGVDYIKGRTEDHIFLECGGIHYYDIYWLCMLSDFNRKAEKISYNQRLSMIEPPLCPQQDEKGEYVDVASWRDFSDILKADKPPYKYYYNDPGYIAEICNASIRFCDILARIIEQHDSVQQDFPQPAETAKDTKSKKSSKKKTRSPDQSEFQPWRSTGDACFIIKDNRIQFRYKDETKDLRLKSESKAHKLLMLLSGGNISSEGVKQEICSEDTKPFWAVRDINRSLNKKIAELGFQGIPNNVAFIIYSLNSNDYCRTIPIKHYDALEREQIS